MDYPTSCMEGTDAPESLSHQLSPQYQQESAVAETNPEPWRKIMNSKIDDCVKVCGGPEEPIKDPTDSNPEQVIDDGNSPYIKLLERINFCLRNGGFGIEKEIEHIYTNSQDHWFTWNFRAYFSEVLERMRWDKIDPHNKDHSKQVLGKLHSVIGQKLKILDADRENDVHGFRYQLRRLYDRLAFVILGLDDQCSQAACSMLERMQGIFKEERSILERSRKKVTDNDVRSGQFEGATTLISDIEGLQGLNQHGFQDIDILSSMVQELQNRLNNACPLLKTELRFISEIDQRLCSEEQCSILGHIMAQRDEIVHKVKNFLEEYHGQHNIQLLQSVLLRFFSTEIKEYQRNQAYINSGQMPSLSFSLQQLQHWGKKLMTVVTSNLQQMRKLQSLGHMLALYGLPHVPIANTCWQYIHELVGRYNMMQEEIISKGLIVTMHPPQVLTKEKIFNCQLCHLAGDAIEIYQTSFGVHASLISTEQATQVIQDGPDSAITEAARINNCDVSYQPCRAQPGVIIVDMKKMRVNMPPRPASLQLGAKTVADVKYTMLFRAEIAVKNEIQEVKTVCSQAFSLPVVVISHGKQESDAQATIFHDNVFSKIDRMPFEVDDMVHWDTFLDAFDGLWKQQCMTNPTRRTCGLSSQERECLTMKWHGKRKVPDDCKVSWKSISRDKKYCCVQYIEFKKVKEVSVTFWTWIYRALELCSSKFVKEFWNLSYIHGFYNKTDCSKMLMHPSERRDRGLFMFRFSDTVLGGISICKTEFQGGQIIVEHYTPDVILHFNFKLLPDMLRELPDLTTLYPNIPKEIAFGRFYSASRPTHEGYVPKSLPTAA